MTRKKNFEISQDTWWHERHKESFYTLATIVKFCTTRNQFKNQKGHSLTNNKI